MRSLLLVALLLVGACNPVLSPDGPSSLTGTWTVQMSFSGVQQECQWFKGCWEQSLTCTGQTTWTVEDDNSLGISGRQTGILSCQGELTGASEMDMNVEFGGDRKGNNLSIRLRGCIQFHGTMLTATTADGTVGGACGNWSPVGTWSATRN